MIDKEKFDEYFDELPARVVIGLDRKDDKNNIIFFKIRNKGKLENVKLNSTQLLIDFSRDTATLGVHDINSYEEFIEVKSKYERWKDK
ncbi:hypothetical protein [Peptostreptococcus porci]|uniref:hypothetical protein n=1 Tax=Peptostreptococcus porci TaxID=2652282 RepID=UPI002A90EB5E|nr:hypothetical protein [Peptostreptococcus porci]MDY6232808.1 hypothetical protein [Peptostreptococcus porci]